MLPAIQIDPATAQMVQGVQLQQALRDTKYRLPGSEAGLWRTSGWQVIEQAYDLKDTYVSYIELTVPNGEQDIPIRCPRYDLYWLYVLQGRIDLVPQPANNPRLSTPEGYYRISYLPAGKYRVRVPAGLHRLFYIVQKTRVLFREDSPELPFTLPPVQAVRNRLRQHSSTESLFMQDGSQPAIQQFLLQPGRTYLQRQHRIYQLYYTLITITWHSLTDSQIQDKTIQEWADTLKEAIQEHIHAGTPISLQILVNQLQLSERYIRYIFHQVKELSPSRYITETKLQYSLTLLQQGFSPTQTANYLNWDPSYFRKAFKARFGQPASSFN